MSSRLIKSTGDIQVKPHLYYAFDGIDTSWDSVQSDRGEEQHFIMLDNCFADFRGQITLDGGAVPFDPVNIGNVNVEHARFVSREVIAWAQKEGGGYSFNSNRGHFLSEELPLGSFITSATFSRKAIFFSEGYPPFSYNGSAWSRITSPSDVKPAFATAISRRLATAGFSTEPTTINFSRVDNENIYALDETDEDEVTRAAFLDIENLLTIPDEITGLGTYETNRLAIFLNDRTIVYTIEPDLEQWSIEDRSNIQVGCISHNTIQSAGQDIFFCSRDGVYSLRRSEDNAVTLYATSLSRKIDLLYRRLLRTVSDYRNVSAVWDQDNSQYHVFFNGDVAKNRLTMTLTPDGEPKWSLGTFLNSQCGAFAGGNLVYGTPGGVYRVLDVEEQIEDAVYPTAVLETPIIWCKNFRDIKESTQLIIQASGKGTLLVEAYTEDNQILQSISVEIEPEDDEPYPNVSLFQQYERRFEHKFRGLRFRITMTGEGLVRVVGLIVNVRKR